jgi:hypothetical protein
MRMQHHYHIVTALIRRDECAQQRGKQSFIDSITFADTCDLDI